LAEVSAFKSDVTKINNRNAKKRYDLKIFDILIMLYLLYPLHYRHVVH
jgi:hypothetical protein